MKYLYAMMDEQTRFWIAQEVADTKYTADVRPLFQLAKQIAGKQPKTLVSDGAPNFHEAYMKEFWTQNLETRTEHIRHIKLSGQRHNNKMERMNGEIRDREKVTRNLKTLDTPILSGMQIYHNYIRPHMALDGKTPAEKGGIKVEGENKWLTIIQNASQHPTVNKPTEHPSTQQNRRKTHCDLGFRGYELLAFPLESKFFEFLKEPSKLFFRFMESIKNLSSHVLQE